MQVAKTGYSAHQEPYIKMVYYIDRKLFVLTYFGERYR